MAVLAGVFACMHGPGHTFFIQVSRQAGRFCQPVSPHPRIAPLLEVVVRCTVSGDVENTQVARPCACTTACGPSTRAHTLSLSFCL